MADSENAPQSDSLSFSDGVVEVSSNGSDDDSLSSPVAIEAPVQVSVPASLSRAVPPPAMTRFLSSPAQRQFTVASELPRWVDDGEGVLVEKFRFEVNPDLNSKVGLWQGDMTRLEIDSIVNAANSSLLGGGGIDGAIHRAAGPGLLDECRRLNGCQTGQAKISTGHRLPAKYIIHTVGPRGEHPVALASCYNSVLNLVAGNSLRSVCFCCISTGIYGYPPEAAAHVALRTTREWLEASGNSDKVDLVLFCAFMPRDVAIYRDLLPLYFPRLKDRQSQAEPPLLPSPDGAEDAATADGGMAMEPAAAPATTAAMADPSASPAAAAAAAKAALAHRALLLASVLIACGALSLAEQHCTPTWSALLSLSAIALSSCSL